MIMRKYLTPLFALGLAFATSGAQAIPLSALFGGADLSVGDKLFTNWGWAPDTAPQPDDPESDIDLSQIEVTGDGANPLNIGLHYEGNGQWNTLNENDALDFNFVFDVTVLDPNFLINGSSLEITETAFGEEDAGYISIVEGIFDEDGNELDLSPMEVEIDNLFGSATLFDSIVFDPLASISVLNNILAFGDDDFAELVSFEQHFSQTSRGVDVPEPSILFLMGVGLAAVGVARRRKI